MFQKVIDISQKMLHARFSRFFDFPREMTHLLGKVSFPEILTKSQCKSYSNWSGPRFLEILEIRDAGHFQKVADIFQKVRTKNRKLTKK